jgi:hypothetical protein
MQIAENLKKIKSSLPENVKLIAVSKFKSYDDILEAYHAGQIVFGENRVQELTDKYEQLPKDIEWHMIGHLQTNKVKYLASFVHMIHGVDSLKLLKEINKQAKKVERKQKCLLQIHIADEETKFGLSKEEVFDLLESDTYKAFENIEICGVMGMATLTDNAEQIHNEFSALKNLFDELKQNYFAIQESFAEISMGMSGDYKIAIAEGSTMVRIGSSIFGARN